MDSLRSVPAKRVFVWDSVHPTETNEGRNKFR